MVKNLPCNAGDTGSVAGQGAEIPRAAEQPGSCATSATKILRATTKTPVQPDKEIRL